MRILFYGDSITDACRVGEETGGYTSYGIGYVRSVADTLLSRNPEKYEILNRGVSGNRIVDLYSRVKKDVWNLSPDVLSILVGVNDIWHELEIQNGVDLPRFEKVYRMMIEDTLERFPNLTIVLVEPFVLEGGATSGKMDKFSEIREYAKVTKKLAEEYGLYFLPLQAAFDEAAKKYPARYYLFDGVHPNVAGARLIADEWIKLFDEKIGG